MAKATKQKLVLEHLREHVGITNFEAFREYNITRLGAIIHELRKKGYDIMTMPRKIEGETGNFAEYRLVEK